MRLISRHGAAGTSLAKIGVAAGYSRGLPGERFGSKQQMLESLIDEIDYWFQARVKRILAGKQGLAAVEARIAAHIDGCAEYPDGAITLYRLILESLGIMPELHTRISLLDQTYRDGFAAHITEGQALGEIRQDIDAQRYATMILGAIRGVDIQALLVGDFHKFSWAKQEIWQVFLPALQARKNG